MRHSRLSAPRVQTSSAWFALSWKRALKRSAGEERRVQGTPYNLGKTCIVQFQLLSQPGGLALSSALPLLRLPLFQSNLVLLLSSLLRLCTSTRMLYSLFASALLFAASSQALPGALDERAGELSRLLPSTVTSLIPALEQSHLSRLALAVNIF